MTNEELQQKIEQLEQQIKDLKVKLESKVEKEPYEVEEPEDIENYYYVSESGNIDLVEDVSYEWNYVDLYKRGLTFKTEEEVKQYDKERILLFKLHKWAEEHNGGWIPDWDDDNKTNYYVNYLYGDGFEIEFDERYRTFTKLPYFKSEEIAELFIKEFGDEIKEVLC